MQLDTSRPSSLGPAPRSVPLSSPFPLPALRAIFGFLKEHRSTRDQSYSNGSGGIGLDSVSRKKPRIFHGSNAYENTTEIDCARSTSQVALWDRESDQKIRITDTVDVEVRG